MPVMYGPLPLHLPFPSRDHRMTIPGCNLAHLCTVSSMCEHSGMEPRALWSSTGSMPRDVRSGPSRCRQADLKREHEHEHLHEHEPKHAHVLEHDLEHVHAQGHAHGEAHGHEQATCLWMSPLPHPTVRRSLDRSHHGPRGSGGPPPAQRTHAYPCSHRIR